MGEKEAYSLTKRTWEIVDLENDGKCEYLAYYFHDGLKVYNNEGDLIWSYGKIENKGNFDGTVFAANVVDINGDGKNEYILAKQKEGIFAFDDNLKPLWQNKDLSETVLLKFLSFKLNQQTPYFLVGSEVSRWHLRDSKGKISELFNLPVGSNPIISGEERSLSDLRFYTIKRNNVKIFDKNGKELLESEAPLEDLTIGENITEKNSNESENGYCVFPKAVWVNLVKGESKYLAIVTSYLIYDRANFYVYDEKGTLIYHELLPEDAETIAVLPSQNGTEEILVGGKDTIWKFSAN